MAIMFEQAAGTLLEWAISHANRFDLLWHAKTRLKDKQHSLLMACRYL